MQQAAARGIQAAGEQGGGSAMAFMGIGMNAANGMVGSVQQPQTQGTYAPFGQSAPQPQIQNMDAQSHSSQIDVHAKLTEMKKLLDDGLITQADFDAVKAKLLGI